MKSFDRWFRESIKTPPTEAPESEPELPDGLYMSSDKIMSHCVSCGDEFHVYYYDPANGWDPDYAYCNSGPPKYCQP
jgi:hypothetical protein